MTVANSNQDILQKWASLLEDPSLPKIPDFERKIVTARLLENAEHAIANGIMEPVDHPLMDLTEAAPSNNTSGIQNFDPVLINLLRRATPKLFAFDLVGVQPMSGPSGQVFYMRTRYGDQTGPEALFDEANTLYGSLPGSGGTPPALGESSTGNIGDTPTGDPATYNFTKAMSLSQAEALGSSGSPDWKDMSMSIDKVLVEAKSRKLKAEYSHEFAQDLKAIHGLDAVNELSNILATELTSEINREVMRTIYGVAVLGTSGATVGKIDAMTDTDGRWTAERWIGLNFLLQTEANNIAKKTRRGKGNIFITSANVASALAAAKILDTSQATAMHIDETFSTFAGTINGIKVYIDPYAEKDFIIVGYKGLSSWDAGLFYCPYTPLQQVKSLTQGTLTPIIGFMSRYGMVQNPFSGGSVVNTSGSITPTSNQYYRLSVVENLM